MLLCSSITSLSFFSFAVLYLAAVYYLHYISSRDPTSIFFDPQHAYEPSYSVVRQNEAKAFIRENSQSRMSQVERQKKMCIGIPSIAREGASYLETSVGSLLDGLTKEERDDIYLIVFIPHTDPKVHPAYTQNWLYNLTDHVLLYDLPSEEMQHISGLEKGAGHREKGLFDYAYLLKACYAAETPYIAMFEDDIVAMDGWYHRTLAGLDKASTLSAQKDASKNFLYLRLFYTEEFLGWNSEDWQSYALWSLLLAGALVTSLGLARSSSPAMKRTLTFQVMLTICGVCLPLVILLFFSAGKSTVLPLPVGVNEMNKYGCCSQGFVFPREQAKALTEWYEMKKIGFVDVLTEEYADEHNELRLALTPSVIQHIGRKSSKGDDFGPAAKYQMSVAEKLWNFAFEKSNAANLKQEHLQAALTLRQGE